MNIEQAADEIYGQSNDPVNVRKKVAFIQGAKWMRDGLLKNNSELNNLLEKKIEEIKKIDHNRNHTTITLRKIERSSAGKADKEENSKSKK